MREDLGLSQQVPPVQKKIKGLDGEKIAAMPEVALKIKSARSKDADIIISEF